MDRNSLLVKRRDNEWERAELCYLRVNGSDRRTVHAQSGNWSSKWRVFEGARTGREAQRLFGDEGGQGSELRVGGKDCSFEL